MRLRSQAAKTRAFHARNAGFDSRRSHQETKFLYNNSGKAHSMEKKPWQAEDIQGR